MSDYIYNLNLSEDTIKSMIEMCPNILELTDKEIEEKISILKSINVDENMLRNIISSNPMYLDRINGDIFSLLNKLYNLGFTSLNTLIDANPYILNLDAFEIENYINKRLTNESLDEIIEDLESNPYLFSEI